MARTAQTGVRFDNKRARLKSGESQRPNGTYMFRWTTEDGERKSIYASTLSELRSKEEQIVVDRHDGIKETAKDYTINDVYELWVQLKRGIKDSTMKNYMYMYRTFVQPGFGKNRISMVKKSDVKKFYNSLVDGKRMKVSTLENIHNVLRQVFQIAVDDNFIRVNPCHNMLREFKASHSYTREKRYALTEEQQKLFLDYLYNTPRYRHWYPVFFVMAHTGMRVGEITGLRWDDVDFKEGMISVNHTLTYYNHMDKKGCYYTINTPKTAAGVRQIPMTEAVRQAFLMEKKYQEEIELTSLDTIDGYEHFIFITHEGHVQRQDNLNAAIKRIIRDCNEDIIGEQGLDNDPVLLPNFSCHNLRHTFATRLCESGINIKVIQDVLGHADVQTTMNIYVDVTKDLKKQQMAAYEQFMAASIQ